MPFDGVIGLNDQLAIGALTVMRANGIEIPRQVQVIGFDNIEESQYLQIPLTTMDSRLEWTAPTAVERILGRIRGEIAKPELFDDRLRRDCARQHAVNLGDYGEPALKTRRYRPF